MKFKMNNFSRSVYLLLECFFQPFFQDINLHVKLLNFIPQKNDLLIFLVDVHLSQSFQTPSASSSGNCAAKMAALIMKETVIFMVFML